MAEETTIPEYKTHLYRDNTGVKFRSNRPGTMANTECKANFVAHNITKNPDEVTCATCLRKMSMKKTVPFAKVEALAANIRQILELYDAQRTTQAKMIRACVERLTRDPDHGVRGSTSAQDRVLIRRKNNRERLEAIEGLRTLARMLDPA